MKYLLAVSSDIILYVYSFLNQIDLKQFLKLNSNIIQLRLQKELGLITKQLKNEQNRSFKSFHVILLCRLHFHASLHSCNLIYQGSHNGVKHILEVAFPYKPSTVRVPLEPEVCILFTPFLKDKNVFSRSFFRKILILFKVSIQE